MQKKYIVALDEGTTSVRAVLYEISSKKIIKEFSEKIQMYYPQKGWVEQDANQIWDASLTVLNKVLENINNHEVAGIGITNQRETVVAWNKKTGKAVCNAIVWQCRRTSDRCSKIPKHIKRKIKNETGLICDAYFSATKIEWLMKNQPSINKLIKEDNLCFGTVDSFLAFKLTGLNVTDTSNASRTMLFSLKKLNYLPFLLKYFNIPLQCLPKVVASSVFIANAKTSIGEMPLLALIGDQQSALFAESLNLAGIAKCTFGTGAFAMVGTGNKPIKSKSLVATVACTTEQETTYALEGSVFNCGDSVEFLKKNLQILSSEAESSNLALSVEDNNGTSFVPAFTGLGSPYWNPYARTSILGIEKSTTKAHIVRACLEGIVSSVYDILNEMKKAGAEFNEVKCNGGGSKNVFMMQCLSNLTGAKVLCKHNSEQTVLGAVYLVGLASKAFTLYELQNNKISINYKTFIPDLSYDKQTHIKQWKKAVNKSKNWTN